MALDGCPASLCLGRWGNSAVSQRVTFRADGLGGWERGYLRTALTVAQKTVVCCALPSCGAIEGHDALLPSNPIRRQEESAKSPSGVFDREECAA